jgi:hypothetical protein
MKSLLTALFLGLLILGAVPAMAQDLGAPDSVMLKTSRPAVGADDSTLVVDLWVWSDSQEIVGATFGWDWDNANLQLDSAVGIAGYTSPAPFTYCLYYVAGSLAQSNTTKSFVINAASFTGTGVDPSGDWAKWASYYFTLTDWNASDSIVIDSSMAATPNTWKMLAAGIPGADVIPVWTGPLVIKDPSDANDGVDLEVPMNYSLAQNYPNPFNPTTTIGFALPMAGDVKLDVFNLLGQKVKTLVNTEMLAGEHKVVWDGTTDAGTRVASGVYFYRLSTDQFTDTKKMLMLK